MFFVPRISLNCMTASYMQICCTTVLPSIPLTPPRLTSSASTMHVSINHPSLCLPSATPPQATSGPFPICTFAGRWWGDMLLHILAYGWISSFHSRQQAGWEQRRDGAGEGGGGGRRGGRAKAAALGTTTFMATLDRSCCRGR